MQFKNVIESVFNHPFSDEQVDTLMLKVDADNDGTITLDEFTVFMDGMNSSRPLSENLQHSNFNQEVKTQNMLNEING